MGEFAVGQGVTRFEDPRLLRGGGRYVDDIVLPGMAVRLRAALAACPCEDPRRSTPRRRTPRPACSLVLTGADWKRSGWGDLPVPGGQKRRDGTPMYRSPYPALAQDRVRWVGDYVAFVVAETYAQAADAAELIEVDYEPLPASPRPPTPIAPGAPRVWDDCADNICFVHLAGDKAAADAAFARADHVVKQRSRHQPRHRRDDGAARLHRRLRRDRAAATRSTPAAACTSFRVRPRGAGAEGPREQGARHRRRHRRQLRHEVGDLQRGARWCCSASKLTGRPVKWLSTRSEAFLSDAEARDNVTDAELALDKDGMFLGMRVKTIANIGAHLQVGTPELPQQSRHARRRLSHARDPCRRDRGLHPHQSGAALSRQRPPGGRLCDRAAGRSRRRRRPASIRWNCAGATSFRRGDAVQDRAHLHL